MHGTLGAQIVCCYVRFTPTRLRSYESGVIYNLCTGRFMHLQDLNSKHSMHKRLYKPLHRAVHSRQLPCHIEEEICKGLLIVRLHPEQADAERQHAKHKHTDEAYVNVDDSEYVAANQLYCMSQTCKY